MLDNLKVVLAEKKVTTTSIGMQNKLNLIHEATQKTLSNLDHILERIYNEIRQDPTISPNRILKKIQCELFITGSNPSIKAQLDHERHFMGTSNLYSNLLKSNQALLTNSTVIAELSAIVRHLPEAPITKLGNRQQITLKANITDIRENRTKEYGHKLVNGLNYQVLNEQKEDVSQPLVRSNKLRG